jgi:hypothetical protein
MQCVRGLILVSLIFVLAASAARAEATIKRVHPWQNERDSPVMPPNFFGCKNP